MGDSVMKTVCLHCKQETPVQAVAASPERAERDRMLVQAWMDSRELSQFEYAPDKLHQDFLRWYIAVGHAPFDKPTQRRVSAAALKLGWHWRVSQGKRIYIPPRDAVAVGAAGEDAALLPPVQRADAGLVNAWVQHLHKTGDPILDNENLSTQLVESFNEWAAVQHPACYPITKHMVTRTLLKNHGWGFHRYTRGRIYFAPRATNLGGNQHKL